MTAWITRRGEAEVAADVAAVDPDLPLAGLRLGVKDNIDVAGLPTTVGCPAYAYDPSVDADVVVRLRARGAVVVGKTNLDQFATGLVGTRSPYGAVESPVAPGYVAGGSSSGSAAAVALGQVEAAIGTDTAGSGRVPAAFCGVVGIKPTRGWLSTRGLVPACRSLDCMSVFARDVVVAAAVTEAAAGFDEFDPMARPAEAGAPRPVARLGRPSHRDLEAVCDAAVVEAFERSLMDAPFEVIDVDLTAFVEAGRLLYEGAFVAERYAAVGTFIEAHPEEVDPTVAAIVGAAATIPAHALAADQARLASLRRRAEALWRQVDAVVVPTVPTHPTLAEVAADPIGVNTRLGHFTNGTNLLDWCAIAVPGADRADGLPGGISLLGPAWSDRAVWAAAAALVGMEAPRVPDADASEAIPVAVCGAHLEGQPLHHQLSDRGAHLLARTATAPCYRMVALDTVPPKPGLVRVAAGHPAGAAIEVEVWDLAPEAFGTFVAAVPPPLAIGTVELADGSWVKGFLCEPHATVGAEDITAFGGWRAWRAATT